MKARTTVARWVAFNVVGLAGMAVQLLVLAILTRVFHTPVAAATLLAVEMAVLHNFWWHERWTWRERPSSTAGERLRRLMRFHAFNGTVSLIGNVCVTVVLSSAGLDPVLANVVAIIACALVNFGAGEWLVFRPTMRAPVWIFTLAALGAPAAAHAQSAAALKGWESYTAAVDRDRKSVV